MDNSSIRIYANSKCLSVEQCKELAKRGKYVNFSAKILEIIARDLTGTALKLWQFLSAESVFDSDWSVQISNEYIAEYLHRSARTVSRLLTELAVKGYIEKVLQSGKLSVFAVRLPAAIAEDFKTMKPRRRPATPDKNVMGSGVRSYYLYNTNNSAAERVDSPKPSAAPLPVVDRTAEIRKYESQIAELGHEINDLCSFMIKNPAKKWETFPKLEKLYEKESILKIKINRLIPVPQKKSIDYLNSPGRYIISEFYKARLKRRVNPIIANQIAFQVTKGDLGRGNTALGINAALKLVDEGRWQTPAGMTQ